MPVIRPYRELLALPGAARFTGAGFLARLPISIVGLGTVVLVEAERDSYAAAGLVSGTGGVVSALAGPRLGRLADRHGQARVLLPATAVQVLSLLALVVLTLAGAPVCSLALTSAVGGAAAVQIGSLVRARWSWLLSGTPGTPGTPRLHTAYALESILDEVIFIVGPIAVTVAATWLHPAAGLLLAGAAALAGGLALAAQRASEPAWGPGPAEWGSGLLRVPGLVLLTATFTVAGGVFGSAEVATVAFAEEHGSPGAAGLVLALWALGSAVSGLAYGAVRWRGALPRRFLLTVVLLAAGTLPLTLVGSLGALAAVMLLVGVTISPVMVAGNALVERVVPASRLTEGLSWVTSGLGLGYAALTTLSGPVIDAHGASRAYLLTLACGVLSVAVTGAGMRWLTPGRPTPASGGLAGGPRDR